MDPQRIQQFIQQALKTHTPDEVNKFIEAQQKTESILKQVQSGLTPEEFTLQQKLQETGAADTLKSQLDLGQLPAQKAIEQQFTLDTEQKKMEQKRKFDIENPPLPTAEQLAKEAEKQAGISELSSNLELLEKSRREIKLRGPFAGIIPTFGGQLDPQVGGFETARNVLAYTMAGVLAGQTGRSVSDRDKQTFLDSLPTRRDVDESAQDKINTTLSLFENKLRAAKVDDQTIKDIVGSTRDKVKELYKPTPQIGQNSNPLAFLVNTGYGKSLQKAYGDEQGNLTNPWSKNADGYTPEQKQAQIDQAINQGMAVGALPMKTASVIKNAPKNLKDLLFPTGKGNIIRETAINQAEEQGKTISGKPIIDKIVEWSKIAKKGNLGSETTIDRIVKSAKNQFKGKLTPKEATLVWDEAGSGYTTAGKEKEPIVSSLDRTLRKVLRIEIDKVAPGFDKAEKLIGKGQGRKELLKKAIFPAAIGAGVSAGVGVPAYFLLNKLLGQRQQ